MKMLRTISIGIFSVATLAFVAGCSVARNQETVGQYVDGSAVTAQVKAKLAEDTRTSALNINVKTIDGGVVQLSGFAKSQQEKDVASQVARSIKGVNSVHNNLIVRP